MHIVCKLKIFKTEKLRFLVDTGAQMNIIQIMALKGNTVINERERERETPNTRNS